MLAQTFPFPWGMPGLDRGVIVRTMDRNPFMLDAPRMAVLVKRLRHQRGPIVGAYHGGFNPLGLPNGYGLSEGTGRIRGFTGESQMIGDNRPITDIDHRLEVEKPVLSNHIAILEVGLPQRIGPGHDPISGKSARMDGLRLALRPHELPVVA